MCVSKATLICDIQSEIKAISSVDKSISSILCDLKTDCNPCCVAADLKALACDEKTLACDTSLEVNYINQLECLYHCSYSA